MPYSTVKHTPDQIRIMRNEVCRRYSAKARDKIRERQKRHYRENPELYAGYRRTEHRREYMRKYHGQIREKRKQYMAEWNCLRQYGITLEEKMKIFAKSKGLCAICESRKATHTDHCHKTGKVRGGLCHKCNTAVGMLDDNPAAAFRVYEYLTRN